MKNRTPTSTNHVRDTLVQSDRQKDIRTPSGYLAAKYDEEARQLIILNHKEFVKIQILPDQKIQLIN